MKRILTALIIATALPAFGQGWTVMGNPVSLCQGGDPLWILWNDTPYNASNNIYSDVSELGVPPLTYPVITLTMLTNLPPTGALNTNAWINYYIRYGTNGTDWLGTNGYSDGSDFAIGNNVRFLDHDTNAPGALTVSFPDSIIGGGTGQWYFAAVAQTIGTNGTFDRGYYNTNCFGCPTVNTNPGGFVWGKAGTVSYQASIKGAAVDASGNVFVGGAFYNVFSIGCGNVPYDNGHPTYVAKLNSAGVCQWSVSLTNVGAGITDNDFSRLALDSSGNVYVCGVFRGVMKCGSITLTSHTNTYQYMGSTDWYIAKLDTSGAVLWATNYGGSSDDTARGIAVIGSGVYVAGMVGPNAIFGGTTLANNMMAVAKLSAADGSVQWVGGFGAPGSGAIDVQGLAADAAGNTYVSGAFSGSQDFGTDVKTSLGGYDAFVMKVGTSGSAVWCNAAGSSSGTEEAYGVAVDPSSTNVIITGFYGGPVNFGGPSLLSPGGIFLVCYNSSGTFQWQSTPNLSMYGFSVDSGMGVAVGDGGNIFYEGYVTAPVYFGGPQMLSGAGRNYFVASVTSSGAYRWAKRGGGREAVAPALPLTVPATSYPSAPSSTT